MPFGYPISLDDYISGAKKLGYGTIDAIKQAKAGLVEATVANSAKTGYRPAILDQPGALAALIGRGVHALQGQKPTEKAFSGDTLLERIANASEVGVGRASEDVNKTFKTHNPENTGELAARILPAMFIPGPKSKAVSRVVNALPKIARIPLKVAAEVALPARQLHPKSAIVVGTAMTAGLDTLMNGQVDPTSGKRYVSAFHGPFATTLEHSPEEAAQAHAPLDEVDQLAMQSAVQVGDAHPDELKDPVDILAEQPLGQHDAIAHDENNKLNGYEQAAIAIGAVLGGASVVKYSHSFLNARSAASVLPENLPQFTGKAFRTSRGGILSKAKTAIIQQDQPIRNMAEEFLGRNYAKQWGYRADRMTNVSIGGRVKHFFQTGELPATGGKTQALAPIGEAFAKELNPDEQRLVSDALNAASSLDDFKATGKLTSLNRDKEGNPVTPAQLTALVDTVRNSPKMGKYFDAIQKSYDDLLKYQVARGHTSQADYMALRARRPNYVAMNRNLEGDAPFATETHRYSANTDQGLGAARSTEEGGGIQGPTGVGNPFVSIFDDWTNAIRRSELNDLRSDFLIKMDAKGALNNKGLKLIEQVTPNRTDDDIHRVRVNGRELAFKVRDPDVARSLHMSPRATYKTLEGLRQAQQSMTTGPLASVFNGFAATMSPVYDAMVANMTRKSGLKLGAANRALIGGYTGAIRYMKDDMIGAMATTLRDNMIRDNSWLKGLIGDNNLDNLASMFENAYDNSIKADMDRLGISSATMHGSPDASKLASGVEKVSPHLAQASESWIRDDIARAAANGDLSPFKAVLATTKSAYATANASRIARVYGSVIEALHNGVKYSVHAANKNNIKDLDEHISTVRRLSADSSQHGSNDLWNKTMGSLMYANLGVQSIYEVARRAKEQPATFLLNMGTLLGTMAALHYGAIGSDPVAMEKHNGKTPAQKARSLTTFGGAEIPIDPVTRLFTAPLFPLYDRISGLSDGKYNPNFFQVMESWLDGDAPSMSNEATQKEQSIGLWDAVQSNNPLAPSSFPLANIGAAYFGVDPGLSRVTDATALERHQQLTGMEDSTSHPDSLVSAHTENMISALGSTTGRSVLQMADDLYRAYNKSGDINKTLDAGLSRWRDNAAKSAGLFRPLLFGDYPSVESASDINYQMMHDREAGIKQATDVMNKDVRADSEVTSLNPFVRGLIPTEESSTPPPEIIGTELEYIASAAQQLQNMYLSKHQAVLGTLGKQVEGYNSFALTPIEDRNVKINKLNEERRYQRLMMLTRTKEYEELISHRIGRPFTFKDFDPKDYLKPLAQEPQK